MFRLESTRGPCSLSGRRRTQGPGGDGVRRCQSLWGALLGEGAALGWDGVRTQDARLLDPILIAGCFAEGRWGGCGVKPGFVCLSLSDPTPGPLLDPESPLAVLGDAKAVRGSL